MDISNVYSVSLCLISGTNVLEYNPIPKSDRIHQVDVVVIADVIKLKLFETPDLIESTRLMW